MSSSLKVGGRNLLFFGTIMVPENESASLTFPDHKGDEVSLRLTFEESKPKTEKKESDEKKSRRKGEASDIKPNIRIREEDGVGVICFIDWTKPFGNSTAVPIVFGEGEDGAKVSFLANITKLGGIYKVEFQVMAEDPS